MNGRVIILCAGEQERWQASYPKQLIRVTNNEVLLARTVRQCRSRFSGEDPLIVSHLAPLRSYSNCSIIPKKRRYITETLLSSYPLWGTMWTIILLGDVYFSDETINTIISNRDKKEYCFYGRVSEIYALTYTDKDIVASNLISVINNAENSICRGKLWDLYYSLSGMPLSKSGEGRIPMEESFDEEHYVTIKDSTDDFDIVERYTQWHKEYVNNERS